MIIFFGFCSKSISQDLSYRIIGKEQGLPTNTIYDIMQDQIGFIWLATNKGIFRYDGVNFKAFKNISQNGKSISNLFEDDKGRIWCQNFSGQFFYIQKDSMYNFTHIKPSGQYFPAGLIGKDLLFSYNSNEFLFTNIHNFSQKKIANTIFYPPYNQVVGEKINLLSLDKNMMTIDKNLNISTLNLKQRLQNTDLFFHVSVANKVFLFSKENVSEFYVLENNKITSVALPEKCLVQNTKLVDERYFAMCSSTGIYLIDYKNNKVMENKLLLKNKSISSIIKDSEGNFWIGTINKGLIFASNLSTKIREENIFFTRIVANEAKKVFFATTSSNGLYKFEHKTNQFNLLKQVESNSEVTSLHYFSAKDKVFFGSINLYEYYNRQIKTLSSGAVKDIEQYNEHTLAIAATNFVALYDIEMVKKTIYLNSKTRNRTILVAPDSVIYVGSSNGFWKHIKDKTIEMVYNNESIYLEDMIWFDGKIFAASPKSGIFCFENDKVLFNLTSKDGLSDNGAYRIKAYKDKIWWLTEKTIQQYDVRTKKITTYDKSNGLPDTELKDLDLMNDTVYVATSQGIAYFPINLHEKYPYKVPQIIPTIFYQDKPIQTKKLAEFEHFENDIDIHFSILSFRNAEQLKVFYQINGQKWVQLPNNARMLSLPALAPASYHIRIKAENVANQATIEDIKFVIKQPFWLTYWFLSLCAIILLGLFLLVYRYRVLKLEQKAFLAAQKLQLEQDLQKSLLTSIKSQMNPHFIFNALNTIQSYIYLNEKQNASNYLVKFSELTRMILEMSDFETVTLRDEIKTIQLYVELEQMRFEDTLVCSLKIAPNLSLDLIKIPSMLIQPYIENAIKHGLMHKKDERKLSIDFTKENEVLVVSIEDNGIGRKKSNEINQQRAEKHYSFASKANQKRLELLNLGYHQNIGIQFFDKIDQDGRACGTKVFLHIPIKQP